MAAYQGVVDDAGKSGGKGKAILLVVGAIVSVGGLGVLVLVGIGIWIYLSLRNKKPTGENTPPQEDSTTDGGSNDGKGNTPSYTGNRDCSYFTPPPDATQFKLLNKNSINFEKLTFSYRTSLRGVEEKTPLLIFYDPDKNSNLNATNSFFAIGPYGFEGTNVSSSLYNGQYLVYKDISIVRCSSGLSVDEIFTKMLGLLNMGFTYGVKSFSTQLELDTYFDSNDRKFYVKYDVLDSDGKFSSKEAGFFFIKDEKTKNIIISEDKASTFSFFRTTTQKIVYNKTNECVSSFPSDSGKLATTGCQNADQFIWDPTNLTLFNKTKDNWVLIDTSSFERRPYTETKEKKDSDAILKKVKNFKFILG